MAYMSLTDIATGLSQKKISSKELVQDYIARIKKHNPTVNAVVTLCEDDAFLQAEKQDKLRESDAENLSPVAGIPIIHKDNFCTTGVRTTCCSKALQDFYPSFNATIVDRFAKSGMIMLGKANMDEFAMGGSNENSSFGSCYNPWDITCVPGGSSGGSAVSVASGFAPLATGSDTGGSIRQPAAFCGITGLKPTYGLIPRYGMVAFASSLDQAGPMARSAKDCALALSVMAGYDGSNDMSSAKRDKIEYETLIDQPVNHIRIGIPKEYYDMGFDKEIQRCIDECFTTFKGLGIEFIDVSIPDIKYCVSAYYTIAPCEASSNLSRFDGNLYGYRSKDDASDIDTFYIKNRSESFGREVKRRILIGTYALSSGYYDDYYIKAQNVRNLIRHDFHEAFKKCDVILAPTTPSPAFKVGSLINDPVKMYQQDLFTIPVNLAELPSISFPVGHVAQLPFGMQIIGPKWSEARLLNMVHKFQQNTNWHKDLPKIAQ